MKHYKFILLIVLVTLWFTASYAVAEDGIYQDKQGVYIKFDSIENGGAIMYQWVVEYFDLWQSKSVPLTLSFLSWREL